MFSKSISLIQNKTVCIDFKNLCNGFKVVKNGKNYHSRTFESGMLNKAKFNAIGSGVYEIFGTCDFSINCKPVETYDLSSIELPKAQRMDYKSHKVVENFDLVGTPARIDRKKGIIEISQDFNRLNEQEKKFILLHEIGHFFYEDEHFCDLFAMVNYLQKGYNKSQAYQAMNNVLKKHPINTIRVKKIFDNLQKVKTK